MNFCDACETCDVTQDYLRSILDYCPDAGVFRWKVKCSNRMVGDLAGNRNSKGYTRIYVLGRTHAAHRLAWLYVHGEWPANQIDHINRDRSDNRICNLRQATNEENQHNQKARTDSSSGLKGINWESSSSKWKVQMRVQGKQRSFGRFLELDDAVRAYLPLAAKYQPMNMCIEHLKFLEDRGRNEFLR